MPVLSYCKLMQLQTYTELIMHELASKVDDIWFIKTVQLLVHFYLVHKNNVTLPATRRLFVTEWNTPRSSRPYTAPSRMQAGARKSPIAIRGQCLVNNGQA